VPLFEWQQCDKYYYNNYNNNSNYMALGCYLDRLSQIPKSGECVIR